MKRPSLTLALASFTLLFPPGCAQNKKTVSPLPGAAAAGTGDDYVTLEFPRSSTNLEELSKADLNTLAEKAKKDGREVEDIKILAWSDKEYPESVERGSPRDVILAKKRAQSIKSYLQEDLHAQEDIDVFNMAKKPGMLSQLVEGEDWKLKEAFKDGQVNGSRLPDGTVSYTKASKALVIIDYKDEQN